MSTHPISALVLIGTLVSTAAVQSAYAAAPVPNIPVASAQLSADTPQTTPGGATFTAPAGWSVSVRGSATVLQTPEPDSHVIIADSAAGTADAAVAAAWAAYHPGTSRPVKLKSPQPARKGWQETLVYDYETSPNERLVVQAVARRRGSAWTVLLIEASEPTFERRLGQLALIRESLRPSGYQRESFAGKPALSLDARRVKLLADFIETGRRELGIPGVALGLIQQGKPIFIGGFGVRELGKSTPVDGDTLFLAASNTKGLTTLLLARLVDEGRFTWETPVSKLYPPFKLGDAQTTSSVLVKHLVCACTGLPRQDFEWLMEYKDATPQTELALLGTMQPTSRFGEVFQYSNLLASVAGFVGGYVLYPQRELGSAYDEAMRTRVFEPLGMKSTTFDIERALSGNHASPHSDDVDGKPARAQMAMNRAIIPLRPAGGGWTSARDLLRYVQFELDRGKLPGGKPYVSEQNLLARRQKQVAIGEDTIYGMGLAVDTAWGIPVVHHGGSMVGYISDMMFLPDHGVGAVVLTNSDTGRYLVRPFLRRLQEILFDGAPEALEDLLSAAKKKRASIAKDRERLVVPADRAQVTRLAARYVNAALGDLTVRTTAGQTRFDLGEWSSAVASRVNDDKSVSMVTIDPGYGDFEFVIGEQAGKRVLTLRDAQHEYVFAEAPLR